MKHLLQRSLAGKSPTLQQVAPELCLSPRTLQRRLTDADITFQQLAEHTHRELAHQQAGWLDWAYSTRISWLVTQSSSCWKGSLRVFSKS